MPTAKKKPVMPPKEMLEADSDLYFATYVAPLFKKAEMSKMLKPLGLAPRGKGSMDRKRKQVSLIIDRLGDSRKGPQMIYLNGSHYTKGDGQWDISMRHWSGWTENFVEKFKGRPKADAKAMMKGVKEMMDQMVDLEKQESKMAAVSEDTTMSKRAKTARSLRKKLIRLAHDHPEKRADAIEALAKMGVKLVAKKKDKMPPELLEKFKGKKVALRSKRVTVKSGDHTYLVDVDSLVSDKYDITVFEKNRSVSSFRMDGSGSTFKDPSKSGKAAYDAVKKEIAKVVQGLHKKDNKKASTSKLAGKDTEEFGRWVMSTQAPMSPSEVEAIVNRTFGVKTSPPKPSTKGLPRWSRGDSVYINASKHKLKKFDISNYQRFNGKTGTVTEIDGVDVMVAFSGERADVRFPGGMSKTRVGIVKYSKPYTVEGSPMMEMYYVAGGRPNKDQLIVVEAYIGRGGATEKRSSKYYTGSVIKASTGGNGWYFMANPQQRTSIDPMKQGRYDTRTFNPAVGQVLYLGILGRRPGNWKADLKRMDESAELSD